MVDFSRGILVVLSWDVVDILTLVARFSTVWTEK